MRILFFDGDQTCESTLGQTRMDDDNIYMHIECDDHETLYSMIGSLVLWAPHGADRWMGVVAVAAVECHDDYYIVHGRLGDDPPDDDDVQPLLDWSRMENE
mgnify:CR=1 FL=1